MFACPVAATDTRTARDRTSYCRLLAGREFGPSHKAGQYQNSLNFMTGSYRVRRN